ncbi:OmpP1/FadL family transporter [Nitratidesulfovibrio vulgaris]|uniref:OmpP1/FadL family transporter n=1 Tax=Nitratidesulfovibrio vulgaris TaxID=881 RepID=UPI00230166C3|nr:outer membrane protein transport protein [Nitratidesulfovibrio vulgaris]WCB46451.1 outer membrane protein transport protein [Nitratidesulfovibrio vulgaris]
MYRFIIAVALCAVWAASAHAAGFAMHEFGARGNALGGAMVARPATDPSSIAFNPALVTHLDTPQVLAGVTMVQPEVTIDTPGESTTTEANVWAIPHAYATTPLTDTMYFGVGAFPRFGLGNEYSKTWPMASELTYVGIQSVSVNPVLGFRPTKDFAFGFGVEAMYFDFEEKMRPLGMDARIKGDSTGFGLNGGMWWQAFEDIALGASFRTPVKQHVKGRATFDNVPTGYGSQFNDTDAEGDITLPGEVRFGVYWQATERLGVEVGAMRTFWSSYDELRIDYGSPVGGKPASIKQTEWEDVWRLSAGAEYRLTDNVDLRAGYVYDEEPVNSAHLDFMVPANDRHLMSLGVGYHEGPWRVDLSYTYLLITDREGEVHTAGRNVPVRFHDGYAHLLGMSAAWEF